MATSHINKVKAPPHDGTPRSYGQDEDDEAGDRAELLHVGRDLHASYFV